MVYTSKLPLRVLEKTIVAIGREPDPPPPPQPATAMQMANATDIANANAVSL